MKRRQFLRISLLSAGAGLPMIGCSIFSGEKQPLSQPLMLSQFCDEAAILEIGKAHQAKDPAARDAKTLSETILRDIYGSEQTTGVEDEVPSNKINDRIRKEYEENLLVTPAGWVLSVTEARQCALYFLTA